MECFLEGVHLPDRYVLKTVIDGEVRQLSYATNKSACWDWLAAEDIDIPPGEWRIVDTGSRLMFEQGDGKTQYLFSFKIHVLSRSGLAAKHGVFVLNAPGVIDEDYINMPIKIVLMNAGKEIFKVRKLDRIAQGSSEVVYRLPLGVDTKSAERVGGFGSTGV